MNVGFSYVRQNEETNLLSWAELPSSMRVYPNGTYEVTTALRGLVRHRECKGREWIIDDWSRQYLLFSKERMLLVEGFK